MQASSIQLGQDYAAHHKGAIVELYVSEIRTVRDRSGTKNYAVGYLPPVDDSDEAKVNREKAVVEVKNVISPLAEHKELMAEKKRRNAARKAAEEAQLAKQRRAITLLAEAIGAQRVFDKYRSSAKDYVEWDEKKAAVMVSGSNGIELNEPSWDALITFVEDALKTRKFFAGSETSLEKARRVADAGPSRMATEDSDFNAD